MNIIIAIYGLLLGLLLVGYNYILKIFIPKIKIKLLQLIIGVGHVIIIVCAFYMIGESKYFMRVLSTNEDRGFFLYVVVLVWVPVSIYHLYKIYRGRLNN